MIFFMTMTYATENKLKIVLRMCASLTFYLSSDTIVIISFVGLLKMLSFGFPKLKIFLLSKTLERYVMDCQHQL